MAKELSGRLKMLGIPVLEDEAVEVEHHECRFWLVGISDYWERAHDVEKAFKAVPRVSTAA